MRIFLRELASLFVFAAGITAVVKLMPAESSLPWTVLLVGVFLGLRTLLRIEASVSEEYRDSLAQRQNLGFLYAASLCAGVALGVWATWAWSDKQPMLGMGSSQLEEKLEEIRNELTLIRMRAGGVETVSRKTFDAVEALPGRLPKPVPYEGPSAGDFQVSQQTIREQLMLVNDNIQVLEKTIREVSREGRR